MQIVRPIILVFLTMKLLVFGQDRPSIHQIQLEYYNNNYSTHLDQQPNEPIISNQPRSTTPTRTVFGYHPYWMGTAWQNYNYNLISTILSDLHGWPVTGLINAAHTNGVDVVLCVTLFNNSD